ncbi:hypothetical protein Drorol1_Dr00008893 [Drosera rotundifolia]
MRMLYSIVYVESEWYEEERDEATKRVRSSRLKVTDDNDGGDENLEGRGSEDASDDLRTEDSLGEFEEVGGRAKKRAAVEGSGKGMDGQSLIVTSSDIWEENNELLKGPISHNCCVIITPCQAGRPFATCPTPLASFALLRKFLSMTPRSGPPSSSSTNQSSNEEREGDEGDCILSSEREAAKALAIMGMSTERANIELGMVSSGRNPEALLPLPFDLNEKPIMTAEECGDFEMVSSSSLCSTSKHGGQGGKWSNNMTKEEKEEQRLRRIMANRESARETIRRRRAHSEELARKAADLASENEELKRVKDVAMKEYLYLERINRNLKEQVRIMQTLEFGNKG